MTNQIFNVERIYVKNSSFETFDTPALFRGEWKPEVSFEVKTRTEQLEPQSHHEVILTVTSRGKINEKDAFVVKADLAGIFQIEGFEDEQKKELLVTYCPNVLYPYARQIVAELMVSGSLPPVILKPLDFGSIYQQQKQQGKEFVAPTIPMEEKDKNVH